MLCVTYPESNLPALYTLLCAFKGVIKYVYDQVC